ncbi:BTB/POZ domain protein [Oesophagostomum dentatum]|uniref:BTB/POZ domain protein n=1 Tax=Oesophagostomum dentatum TaxID=61180 RepID=A0A0B1TG17_OESDE|nr:BTB/POZ domain protein [Oesophagostomum dentatum]
MLTSQRFADFVVVVEGREFNLHRCVLVAASQYFSAMLKDQTKEAAQGRVELKGISADVFDIIVRYTLRLMIDGLKSHCCAVLMRGVTVSNFALRLQISDFLDDDKLFRRLVAFLASNRKDVFANADWAELKDVHPKLATRVLEASWTYADTLLPFVKPQKRRRFGY